MNEDMELEPIQFEDYHIRRVWDDKTERWYFAVVDVIEALTNSQDPNKYWFDMKRREKEVELSANCRKFKLKAKNNRLYQTECADTEGMFRIIQSIPSPKAEPFKRWLAKVGYERLQEVENPELAAERARELYKAKGYSDEWIERRLQSIVTRNELTDEWRERGVKEGQEFGVLTSDIARETFGITPAEHKQVKKLKRENLRDHMTGLELAFTILGEAAATEITRKTDAQGFPQNQVAARQGGQVAGEARYKLEQLTGEPVVSPMNYLKSPQAQEQLPLGDEDGQD